jgi:hypothetical protein
LTFPQSVVALVGDDRKRVTAISPPSPQTGNLNLIGSPTVSVTSTGQNTMTIATSGSGVVSSLTGNSGGAIRPTLGNINIIGTGTISVAGSGNSLTIGTSGLSFIWNNNATSRALASNNGYIITAGSQTFTLPATPSIGDLIEIILNGGTAWTVTLSGKTIKNGSTVYSNSVSSNGSDGVSLRIVCVNISSNWIVDSLVGSLIGN